MKNFFLGLLALLSCNGTTEKKEIEKSDIMNIAILNYSSVMVQIDDKIKNLDSYDVVFTSPVFLDIMRTRCHIWIHLLCF